MESKTVKWGILSTAKIGREYVIPAMNACTLAEASAIASRNTESAKQTAVQCGVSKAYGTYEEILDDPTVDAIYNPLPNHLHAEWSIKAIEKGKHVLCEKPMAITMEEMEAIKAAKKKYGVKVGEAFMVRSNPQWHKVRTLIQSGFIGEIKAIQGFFSFYNDDPNNIRNKFKDGGGALWDIGCYPITTSRFVTGEEPSRVMASIDFDPEFGVDRLSSIMLDYPSCKASFIVSTQALPYQRMMFFGTKKIIEVKIPFNAPLENPMTLEVHDGDLTEKTNELITVPVANQYEYMINDFSKAILENTEVPVTVENAMGNLKTILAAFESGKLNQWVDL